MKFKIVQIQTTSVCNASCIICPQRISWMRTPEGRGYMTDKLFNKILEDINKTDPTFDTKICPYLANEPFADPKIIERVDKIYNTLYNPLVELSSNMELVTPDKTDKLYEILERNKFRVKFVISHFGIDKESLEYIMKINYEKALENIIYLVRKFDGNIPIAIQTMSLSNDRKILLINPGKIRRYWSRIFKENNLSWRNVNLSTMRFHNRAGNVKLEGWDYNKVVRQIDKGHPFDCWRLHNTLHVLWNGEVTLCCMSPYRHEAIFGNLNNQTIEEVFNSEEWKHLYNQARGFEESPPDFICKRCTSPGG